DHSSNLLVNDGEWHMVTAIFNRDGYVSSYVDGKLDKQLDISSKAYDAITTSVIRLGFDSFSGGSYLEGSMDEARIYKRSLSAAEVVQLYNYAPKPVGYWDFEEGEGL